MANQERKQARAPYNFVPFTTKVFERYHTMEELPAHGYMDRTRKTGEIHVTLQAETPVFVSNGNRREPDFFRTADGKYAIPGSSVRGMTRQNMQILGFGFLRAGEEIEDQQIYFRDMASGKNSVQEELRKYYKEVLCVKAEKGKTIPLDVKAGYLHREGGKYYIVPTAAPYLCVSRSDKDLRAYREKYAAAEQVFYQTQAADVTKLRFTPCTDMKKGMLLFTGKPVGKPNHCYLFPEEDPDANPEMVADRDILSYEMDLEGRENTLKRYDVNFWKLPKEHTCKPVFYVRHNGHTYFGMTLYLRIGYQYSLCEGLPRSYQKDETEKPFLDYPSAILGFARGQFAYRSRVRFEDFVLQGNAVPQQVVKTVLGSPKPSYYPNYVKDGKHYNIDPESQDKENGRKNGFALRGYKQYWLKEAVPAKLPNDNENVATVLRPLDTGSTFRGVIRFENLSEDELGLLLWSLRLEEGCCQSIGMGKPYGYGRMKLTIDAVRELDIDQMYQTLSCPFRELDAKAVDSCIKAFQTFLEKHLEKNKKKLEEFPEIQDFFYIKRTIRNTNDTSYMALSEYRNVKSLTTIEEVRKKNPVIQEEPQDVMAALLAKFGPHHANKKK